MLSHDRLRLGLGVFLLGFLLFSQDAMAAVGRVYYVSGGVYIERGAGKVPVEKDSLLQNGDIIVTESDGRVQWRLSDDSFFVLRPNSKFKIDNHQYPEGRKTDPAGFKAAYELLSGGMRTLTGLIASGNKAEYQVRSPVATMGVRGTDYTLIHVSEEQAAKLGVKAGLYIRVDSGSVVVTNSAGSIELQAGQYGFVAGDSIIPVVLPDAPAVFINWAVEFEFLHPGLGDAIDRLPIIEPILEPDPPASPN